MHPYEIIWIVYENEVFKDLQRESVVSFAGGIVNGHTAGMSSRETFLRYRERMVDMAAHCRFFFHGGGGYMACLVELARGEWLVPSFQDASVTGIQEYCRLLLADRRQWGGCGAFMVA